MFLGSKNGPQSLTEDGEDNLTINKFKFESNLVISWMLLSSSALFIIFGGFYFYKEYIYCPY